MPQIKFFLFNAFKNTFCFTAGSGLNDGQWHAIRLVAKENFAMMTINGEEASAVRSTSPLSITTGGTYHLGGKGYTKHLWAIYKLKDQLQKQKQHSLLLIYNAC